ncbi:phosphoserine transaminase [Bacillus carboniphilus]|uniref:Phosphoserine aminotransferase n=1 Tax=Bacillus carboniphilus TaxID=86663 RepID=A0ABY9JTX5_9BACI|nr:phosphoserine transaminase [Bacillus carboniphilus]WLR42844.1 phosphoserine transaminase [Bacillus carboniphilus]
MERVHNFNAGPAALPESVIQQAKEELLNFQQTGMSIMEMSHRSKEYDLIHNETKQLLLELLSIPNDYEILFLQGGASQQFALIPMNFLSSNQKAYYVMTGSWSEKALKEAKKIGQAVEFLSSKEDLYRYIPTIEDKKVKQLEDAAYLHLTSNNTIYGTQWNQFPNYKVPLFADMSSDIMSREIKIEQFDFIYAGAQKNLGPAGVTVVIMKKSLIEQCNRSIPAIFQYKTHANKNSLYNTPPTFSIYMLSLVLEWIKQNGGIQQVETINNQKAKLLYDTIDNSQGFYTAHALKDSRSKMNVTFTLKDEHLTNLFLKEAKEHQFIGLNGHRSIGGCRASIYNAVSLNSVQQLSQFMHNFQKRYE